MAEVGVCESLVFQLVVHYFMHRKHLQQKEGLVFFKELQSDTGLKQHWHQGTQLQSASMVIE